MSSLLTGITVVGAFGGKAKGWLYERPRMLLAYPNAKALGRRSEWVAMFVHGQPTSSVIPTRGGTFLGIEDTWRKSWAFSSGMQLALTALGVAYFAPNLVSGVRQNGFEGIHQSREGRIGVSAAIATGINLGLLRHAARVTPRMSTAVVERIARVYDKPVEQVTRRVALRHVESVLANDIFGRRSVAAARIGAGLLIGINIVGYGDVLNAGDDRSAREVFRDSNNVMRDKVTSIPSKVANTTDKVGATLAGWSDGLAGVGIHP